MPALVGDYCELAEVKAVLKLSDPTADTRLAELITAVSRGIDAKCERRIYAATETRTYTATGWYELVLEDDLLSVTTLATDQDGDRVYETVWAAADYDLLPYNAPLDGYPYHKIAVNRLQGRYGFPPGLPRAVQILGSFGYAAQTPPGVRQACILQTVRSFRRDDAPFGVVGSGEFGQATMGQIPLDPDYWGYVNAVRRLRVA